MTYYSGRSVHKKISWQLPARGYGVNYTVHVFSTLTGKKLLQQQIRDTSLFPDEVPKETHEAGLIKKTEDGYMVLNNLIRQNGDQFEIQKQGHDLPFKYSALIEEGNTMHIKNVLHDVKIKEVFHRVRKNAGYLGMWQYIKYDNNHPPRSMLIKTIEITKQEIIFQYQKYNLQNTSQKNLQYNITDSKVIKGKHSNLGKDWHMNEDLFD